MSRIVAPMPSSPQPLGEEEETPPHRFTDEDLTALRPLQQKFPNLDAVVCEIARLSAECTLPKGTVHVISDIHGEHDKLRHVVNNASGMLRPLVEQLFKDRLSPAEFQEFLTLIFYPVQALEHLEPRLRDAGEQRSFCRRVLRDLFIIVRTLARRYTQKHAARVFPAEFAPLFNELLHESSQEHGPAYYDSLVDGLVRHGRALHAIRMTVRVVRNLAVDELIIAGDCWDRGPRGDRVVDYLVNLPNLAFTWGNHDTAWLGACLGQEALIAHVLRISLRYRRSMQLEEGYGISILPLELLVDCVYKDDPATCFTPKAEGRRNLQFMARMQKAAAVLQFKLEGQTIERNPEWGLGHRRLLHTIDRAAGTIVIDGLTHSLRDRHFPTLDPARPYELTAEERKCMDRLRQSFHSSLKLWEHMKFLLEHGSMHLVRDDHLVFHGCVPVDEQGQFLAMVVDGRPHKGRALFDALDAVLARSLERPTDRDRDLMWYLWCGPRSPLFGKDRIATLENDLIEDKHTHEETKNPYFQLIHEVEFCDRILKAFGVDPARGLIVNGHVPVKIEKGESPVKRSGKAITIDGAFSAAYGDHGYTLVLEPERTLLAKHHHFESVAAAVREGVDIIPEISVLRQWERPRTVGDTERGAELRRAIAWLERLARAYRGNQLQQKPS